MTSCTTVHDCVTSALDKDCDLTMPSTQTKAVQDLAAKVRCSITCKYSSMTVSVLDPAVAELTVSEHNAFRYAAGYVPHALIVKGSHPYKGSYLRCLSSMAHKGECPTCNSENVQAFTKQWLSAENRLAYLM